jgi:hypothetical protein
VAPWRPTLLTIIREVQQSQIVRATLEMLRAISGGR